MKCKCNREELTTQVKYFMTIAIRLLSLNIEYTKLVLFYIGLSKNRDINQNMKFNTLK